MLRANLFPLNCFPRFVADDNYNRTFWSEAARLGVAIARGARRPSIQLNEYLAKKPLELGRACSASPIRYTSQNSNR